MANDIHDLKNLIKALLVVVFITLIVMTTSTVMSYRAAQKGKEISEQNNKFLGNFSDYMRCLVVNDDNVVKAVGLETYFNLCDDLLFRNTGKSHAITKVKIPDTTTTTIETTTEPTSPGLTGKG
jgi:hypothetical protein